jgi:Predicted membrane protein
MDEMKKSKKIINIITRVSIFGALAIILYMVPGLQFNIPFAPAFLKIHLDEIPVLLAGLAYGSPTAFLIIVLKSVFKLIQDISETMGIGVLSDFIYGCALVLPITLIYNRKRSFVGIIIGMLVGLLSNLLASCFIGLYAIFPLYGLIYEEATIVNMFKVFDPSINSLMDFKIIYEFLLPFNILKDSIVIAAVFLVYKPMRIIIKRIKK